MTQRDLAWERFPQKCKHIRRLTLVQTRVESTELSLTPLQRVEGSPTERSIDETIHEERGHQTEIASLTYLDRRLRAYWPFFRHSIRHGDTGANSPFCLVRLDFPVIQRDT